MIKRLVAAAAAAATAVPLLVVAGATPAAAADCRNEYAQGNYVLRISPAYALVRPGSTVRLTSRLVRTNAECSFERIGYFTRGRNQASFRLAVPQQANARGLVDATFTTGAGVTSDFRWYTNFNLNAVTPGARSSVGLVQVRAAGDRRGVPAGVRN